MKHVLEMCYPSSWWHDLWREGLAIGNGLTGANLYGGAGREILQLGRHDMWCDGLEDEVPYVKDAFLRQRKKIDSGLFDEANWEIVNALRDAGYSSRLEIQLPVANLIVEQTPIKGFCSFRRRLDMERAVASQQWLDGHVRMHREVFVSRAADVVVYRLRAEDAKPGRDLLEYKLELNVYRNEGQQPTDGIRRIWDAARTDVICEDEHTGYLYFNSRKSREKDTWHDFGAVARLTVITGRLEKSENKIIVRGADQLLITICLYVGEDRESAWQRLHDKLCSMGQNFDELLAESAELHKALYHSAELHLRGVGKQAGWKRTNEELLMEAFSEKQSPELIEKLWHYGRYLFICGSGPSSNPFPLYGLWGGGYVPLWCHNMANENLQMIYWHSLSGNLIEHNRSIFQYINDRIEVFKENGRKLFGIDGIYMTAGTTPGVSTPTQLVPVIINWVGAAGWIAQHYYQYFMYTRDMKFVQEIMFPYMDGVAAFYEQFVQFVPDGNGKERVKVYPSVSPENSPGNFIAPDTDQMTHPMPTTINSTIDLAILKEFFYNLLEVCKICGEIHFSKERIYTWQRILAAIPEFKNNRDGTIKEWQEDGFEDRYEHRHLSHIYPVFPGYEVYPEKDPGKFKAYETAVSLRRIDAQTGWSMTHMAAVYARFRNGDAAMECLDNMARSSLLNNFFTLHNDWRGMNVSLVMDPAPVQLDAIMGYVNAIQEMLLYAAPGYIALLPALEERLSAGEVKSFRYSDGLLNMKWDREKKYFEGDIIPLRPHKVQVVLPDFVGSTEWRQADGVNLTGIRDNVWEVEFQAFHAEALHLSSTGV